MSAAGGARDDAPDDEGRRLPASLRSFVDLVNRGEYWESHEALEEAWRETRSGFYHGLILYASAFVHARRDTPHGVVAQLEKAEQALAGYPDEYLGLDLARVRSHARRSREAVESHRGSRAGDEGVAWSAVVDPPSLSLRADRIRGDEPELSTG